MILQNCNIPLSCEQTFLLTFAAEFSRGPPFLGEQHADKDEHYI